MLLFTCKEKYCRQFVSGGFDNTYALSVYTQNKDIPNQTDAKHIPAPSEVLQVMNSLDSIPPFCDAHLLDSRRKLDNSHHISLLVGNQSSVNT